MQEHKTTKLVQACSSSAMLEQHGSSRSTRSSRLARLARQSRTCRVKSSRVEPSGIWAFTVAKAILEVLTVCNVISVERNTQRLVIIVLGTAAVKLAQKSEGF